MKKDHPFPFTKPEDKSGYLMYQVNLLWQRRVTEAIQQLNLTHTQFLVMVASAWLDKQEKEVTQSNIGSFLQIDRMLTSRVLKKLIEKGLIIDNPKANTRSKSVKFTDEGYALIKKAIPIMRATEQEFFGSLGDDHQKLNEILRTVLKHNPCKQ